MKHKDFIFILAFFILASCGKGGEGLDRAENSALNGAAATLAPANDSANAHRHDPVLGLIGTEEQLGAVHPDCTAFPPATGPHSVLGLTPGMTLPQASSTLRCQFPDIRNYDNREVYFHSFTGIRGGPNVRMSFGVEIPATANRPAQQVDVYLAGGMNRERVFAIRTESSYNEANRVPIATVTAAVAEKYGPLAPRYYGDYSHASGEPGGMAIFSGLGAPVDTFCMGLIGSDYLEPYNGTYNQMSIQWDQVGACGARLYYKPTERDGIAVRMQLLLIDFSPLPTLHAQEVADVEQTRQQSRDAEMQGARRNAEQGGTPRL